MIGPLRRDSLLGMVLAPAIWFAHFNLVYVAHALACTKGWGLGRDGPALLDVVIAGVTLVTLAALAGLALLAWRRWRPVRGEGGKIHSTDPGESVLARRRFMALTSLLLCFLSAIGTIYVVVPVLVLPKC